MVVKACPVVSRGKRARSEIEAVCKRAVGLAQTSVHSQVFHCSNEYNAMSSDLLRHDT